MRSQSDFSYPKRTYRFYVQGCHNVSYIISQYQRSPCSLFSFQWISRWNASMGVLIAWVYSENSKRWLKTTNLSVIFIQFRTDNPWGEMSAVTVISFALAHATASTIKPMLYDSYLCFIFTFFFYFWWAVIQMPTKNNIYIFARFNFSLWMRYARY